MSDYLPSEILVNIFVRLPVKTILVCTSICKSWHSLIRSPNFFNLHLNRPRNLTYTNNHDLLLVRSSGTRTDLYSLHCDTDAFEEYAELESPFGRAANKYYRIVGCCNGILCLDDLFAEYEDDTILWNPSVRKWVTLPRPRITYYTHDDDDDEFSHAIGFGFDAKNNDHKVVRIVHFHVAEPEVDIYSLSTGTWRDISDSAAGMDDYVIAKRAKQVYVNGSSHWLGDFDQSYTVVSFDMSEEIFRCIQLPAAFDRLEDLDNINLSVIQYSLALFEQNHVESKWSVSIWVMQQYGMSSSWCRQFNVHIDLMDRLIGFRKEGDLLIVTSKGQLNSHDLKAARVKELGIWTPGSYEYSFDTYSYAESLVLLASQWLLKENEEGEITSKGADNRVVAGLQGREV